MVKGRGGRPRKPTALKLLHGDFDKDPQLAKTREPLTTPGKPRRPAYLDATARRMWDRVTKELHSLKVITKADRGLLELLATSYSLYRQCLADVREHGCTYEVTDTSGKTVRKRNPADAALLEHSRMLHRYLAELGMTPASRTRIEIDREVDTRTELERRYLS